MSHSLRSRLRAQLVERYAHLRRRLEYIVGSRDGAADALQETWLRLEAVADGATVANADAYLLQMAVNAATDRHRHEQRRFTEGEIDAMFDVEDELADPERIVAARREIEVLEKVLRRLTPRQRAILLAAQVDGLLNREIAARFDISQSLVEKELRYALRYCHEHMQPSHAVGQPRLGGPRKG